MTTVLCPRRTEEHPLRPANPQSPASISRTFQWDIKDKSLTTQVPNIVPAHQSSRKNFVEPQGIFFFPTVKGPTQSYSISFFHRNKRELASGKDTLYISHRGLHSTPTHPSKISQRSRSKWTHIHIVDLCGAGRV